MTDEIPDGLAQLRQFLLSEYSGVLEPAESGSPIERERNFLSRALAAYAIQKLANCTAQDAADAVVDGGGDGGIDAVYYAKQTTEKLYFVQSKFISKGTGEPEGVEKFINGLEAVLTGDFAYFAENKAWQKLMPQILALLNKSDDLEVNAIFIYSSIHPLGSPKIRQFEKLKQHFPSESNYLRFQQFNLWSIQDWLTGADEPTGVPRIELTLHYPGMLDIPYKTIFGLIRLEDIARHFQEYGKQLIQTNIRGYKGDTDVNKGMMDTLSENPGVFVYLNNGMTAYCSRFNIFHVDKPSTVLIKRITANSFSIVNGAQTLGTIGQWFAEKQLKGAPEGYVFIKIVSLEGHEDEVAFAQNITRTANYQNRIDSHNFIALEPYHQEIARLLKLSEVYYHFRDDTDTPASDEHNFTFKEAATALACLDQIQPEDLIAQILAKREALWSMEACYPNHPDLKTRYSRVFRTDRSARTVWRAVQTQSIVIEKMKASTRAESIGVRKAFFENARWLILHLVLFFLRPEQGNNMTLTPEEVDKISIATDEYAEALWSECESQGFVRLRPDGTGFESPHHFRSVFSNPGDCGTLRKAMFVRLNQKK